MAEDLAISKNAQNKKKRLKKAAFLFVCYFIFPGCGLLRKAGIL